MSIHERPVGASVEWYTPPSLFDALGLTFDLDPASPEAGPVAWVPAERFIAPSEDGTAERWNGRVWLNPPYGPAGVRFIEKMVFHHHGLMLLPARTETRIFQWAAGAADDVVFLKDRLHFIRPDGYQARSSFGSALLVYGIAGDYTLHTAVVNANLGWRVANDLSWRDQLAYNLGLSA